MLQGQRKMSRKNTFFFFLNNAYKEMNDQPNENPWDQTENGTNHLSFYFMFSLL